jgi:DNA replication protein DnaC
MDEQELVRLIDERRATLPATPERAARINVDLRTLQQRMLSRASPQTKVPTAEEFARYQTAARTQLLNSLLSQVGPRYRAATLDNFERYDAQQSRVVEAVRQYAGNWPAEQAAGNGIVLFGPSGTGKDHLLIGLARMVIMAYGVRCVWCQGADLFARFRDGIDLERSEAHEVADWAEPDVLILSDPICVGGASRFEASILVRIIDRRYRQLRPTWVSLNVARAAEAEEGMGQAVVDRLRHGSLNLFCEWPSYRARKARRL